jgi:hypothetical protein
MSERQSSRPESKTEVEPAKPAPRRFAWWEWFDVLEMFSFVLVLFFE